MIDTIKFATNWNNKLNCTCFTTFRMATSKYQINKAYRIELKGKYLGTATVKGLRIMTLSRVNEFISFLDTAYEPGQFVNMVKTMYKNKNIDPVKQNFYLILLKWNTQENINFKEDGQKTETKVNQPALQDAHSRLPD